MREIDGSLPSRNYEKLIAPLSRRHANLLLQLRTGHIPLNTYFKHIARPCPGRAQRVATHPKPSGTSFSTARTSRCIARCTPRSLSTLLNSEDALRPLFAYINATGRLRSSFGRIPDLADDGQDTSTDRQSWI